MASTRLKFNTQAQVFHRVATATDMPQHDIATTNASVSSLGGSADYEIDTDSNTTYVTVSKAVTASGGGVAITGSASITKFLYIKHTGFTTSDKDVATTQLLKIGVGDPDVIGFTLSPGEAICLHGLGTSADDISNWYGESASGNIYAEIIYL